ncbi:MAG TPA: hypothetical protein VE842_01770 [Pyrinomonadaceae bacterium]|jgi:hypothetical protein|nr:hypothetical protein [Pyrinomonadaceae bacterium]
MLHRTLIFFAIVSLMVLASAATAQAQLRRNESDYEDRILGSPEKEMRARLVIRQAEKERRENLERAREVAQLGTWLREAYTRHKTFDDMELKKLERLEKLTRKIRSEAGGSDDEEIQTDLPRDLDAALSRIAKLSEELSKGVEKTPRLVISAAVIDHANQLLDIINYVRNQTR